MRGELLLDLRYIRNFIVYFSIIGQVSYYLVYGTSETERQRVAHRRMVNYYLDYGTSETFHVMLTAPER